MELAYPPFEMTDEHNQPSGIGVELAQALANALHKELVIENTQFTGLIPALKTGKIDLIISSMTATDRTRRVHRLFRSLHEDGHLPARRCQHRDPERR